MRKKRLAHNVTVRNCILRGKATNLGMTYTDKYMYMHNPGSSAIESIHAYMALLHYDCP